jgi:ankyrin repeat protein
LLGDKVSTEEWNPLHLAIYYGRIDIVKFYLEELQVNPRLSLMGPLENDPSDSDDADG